MLSNEWTPSLSCAGVSKACSYQLARGDEALAAYDAARRVQQDILEEMGESPRKEEALKLGKGAPMLEAARYLLDIHATSLAEKALALCQIHAGANSAPYAQLGRLYMQREDYVSVQDNLSNSITLNGNVEAWTLSGHSFYLQKNKREALKAYKKALEIDETPCDRAVYLRYGELLLDAGKPDDLKLAKQIFLKACTSWATSSSWLGVAIACYMLEENDEAEAALVEANIADNQNGAVWAYTTLVCLRLQRIPEADHAYNLALRSGVDRREVLLQMGEAYVAAEQPALAEKSLRRAMAMKGDLALREMLANACRDMGDVDGAVEEYRLLMEESSMESKKQEAIKQIVKILKGAKRDKEAHKYQKMLKK